MKVCLAALIPLLACLLVLPSDVSGRRRIRQELEEQEYEDEESHIKRRSEYMGTDTKEGYDRKLCAICHKYYDIDEDDCLESRGRAKLNCLKKAEDNEKFFGDKMSAPLSREEEERQIRKRSEEYMGPFSRESYDQMLCSLCHKYYHIDEDDCISDRREQKLKCLEKAAKNKKFFAHKLEEEEEASPSPGEDKKRHIGKRSGHMGSFSVEAYDKKMCSLCHEYYQIDEDDCVNDRGDEKYKCLKKATENEKFFGDKMNAAFPVV